MIRFDNNSGADKNMNHQVELGWEGCFKGSLAGLGWGWSHSFKWSFNLCVFLKCLQLRG